MSEIITPGESSDTSDQPPKIVVDSDWKAEAQAEKEKLKQQESKQVAKGDPKAGQMPNADFTSVVRMLATQSLMYLGAFPDPESGQAVLAPDYAQYHIDLLGVLEEKTKGNLTDEETKELEELLRELRSRFVQVMGSVSESMLKQQSQEANADLDAST